MTERPALPRTAEVVVIGAGAIGCSVAYHLAKRGQRGVVVLEREFVGAGSTSKAAGGIRCQWGHEGGRVAAVETTRGAISPGVVVDAAGPQAALVGRMAGLDLPVNPRRRHVFVTDAFERVRHPMPLVIDRGSGFYVRSEGRSLL